MDRKIILGHPFGNANVRQALLALSSEGMLEAFVTTVCAEQVPLLSLLPAALRAEIERRSFGMLSGNQITAHPFAELRRLLFKRAGRTLPLLARFGPSVDDIWRSVDQYLTNEARRRRAENLAVYAYEDGALVTFTSLPKVRKIYELPIGYWKVMHSILNEERELKPEWSATLTGLSDSQEKLERKDRELELSDQVVVPSDFVRSTLPPQCAAKANVVRYGCPVPVRKELARSSSAGALKVLFCGSLGQRKGISYLFEAVRRMGHHVELTVVGSEVAVCTALTKALETVTWHRSLPHSRVLDLMRGHDVFLFPTLFEGRALVVLEALSQGLPVVTTDHSGASDVIIDGRTGFLVPTRSVDAIVQALETLYDDRTLLAYMKEQALVMAAETSWQKYRRELIGVLKPVVGTREEF